MPLVSTRILSTRQWCALVALTVALMLAQVTRVARSSRTKTANLSNTESFLGGAAALLPNIRAYILRFHTFWNGLLVIKSNSNRRSILSSVDSGWTNKMMKSYLIYYSFSKVYFSDICYWCQKTCKYVLLFRNLGTVITAGVIGGILPLKRDTTLKNNIESTILEKEKCHSCWVT